MIVKYNAYLLLCLKRRLVKKDITLISSMWLWALVVNFLPVLQEDVVVEELKSN